MNIVDKVANRKISNEILSYNCIFLFGDRGCGKSTLLSYASKLALEDERPVFCNYPVKNCFKIPTVVTVGKNGDVKELLDKQWLYSADFPENSLILLDEVSTVWNARDFRNWNENDSEFFNFIRKRKLQIILASQYYDQVDLNVKRACDVSMFVHKRSFLQEFSYIDVAKLQTVKVADKNTEILGKDFRKGARMVRYDVAEIPLYTINFYRKPYYELFDTFYVPFKKQQVDLVKWNDLI